MSEANILNPDATSPYNPGYDGDFDLPGLPELDSTFQAMSGQIYARALGVRGRTIPMKWNNRLRNEADYLRQWGEQYRNGRDFFTYYAIDQGRYFSGCFFAPGGQSALKIAYVGNDKWNVSGIFVELPGLALYAYPTNWARDAIFLEERDSFGKDVVKLSAGWGHSEYAPPVVHGGGTYVTTGADNTAEWLYFGYGFRYWARIEGDMGIAEIFLDGLSLGNVDLYAAVAQNSGPRLTKADAPLGLHRMKIRCTGTKNPLSSNTAVEADAIEVMR